MGTYTEFSLSVKLRKDTPYEVVEFLAEMIMIKYIRDGYYDTVNNIPYYDSKPWDRPVPFRHVLFTSSRWEAIFTGSMEQNCAGWTLTLRNEFKNYDCEIQRFLDWIKPYIRGRKKRTYLGWCKNEMRQDRTYYTLTGGGMITNVINYHLTGTWN